MHGSTANLALFRTYRPHDFSELVGQQHVQRTILNALKAGRASHAYLFSGPRGTGKTTTARLVAKGLLCPELLDQGPEATSPAWEDILAGRHLDLIEIDAASNRGIDEIRDLREKVRFSPSQGPKKVFIIDEVHMLTTEAFNALLKTLEEPPAHAHFVLATTERHKVPATIISRCQHFEFRRIPEEQIITRMREIVALEKLQIDDEALPLIAHAAQGGLRDALVLLEQVSATSERERTSKADVQAMLGLAHVDAVQDFLVALFEGDAASCLAFVHTLYASGADLAAFTRDVISMLRERMVANVLDRSTAAVPFELAAIRAFEQALLDQKVAGVPELPLELAVLELLRGTLPQPGTAPALAPARAAAPAAAPAPASPPPPAPPAAPVLVASPVDTAPIDVREHWNSILAGLKNGSVRLAARKAQLSQPDASTVELAIGNKFEYDKLGSDQGRHDIEEAIHAATGRRIRVVPKLITPAEKPAASADVSLDSIESFLGGTAL